MAGFEYGETLVLHGRSVSGQDGDGNDVYGDTDAETFGWVVYPRNSSELVQGQDTLITGLTATSKGLVTVAGVDAVSITSGPYMGRYDVDGLPGYFTSPFSGDQVTELHLTRITG